MRFVILISRFPPSGFVLTHVSLEHYHSYLSKKALVDRLLFRKPKELKQAGFGRGAKTHNIICHKEFSRAVYCSGRYEQFEEKKMPVR